MKCLPHFSLQVCTNLVCSVVCRCTSCGKPGDHYTPEQLRGLISSTVHCVHLCYLLCCRSVPPLVPFNLGSLGFLTPFDPARLEQVLHRTVKGKTFRSHLFQFGIVCISRARCRVPQVVDTLVCKQLFTLWVSGSSPAFW